MWSITRDTFPAIIYKLSYLKKRHKLTDKQIKALELVFDKDISAKYTFSNAYTNVVKRYNSARRREKNNPLVTDIPFTKLINEIQEEVITIYKESKAHKIVPNGYPVFNASL